MSKIIAIIPARGGSKRLPRKNILPLGGVPLLSRVIRTARNSDLFDKIVVSSEDDEILMLAKEGAIAQRPVELASDVQQWSKFVLRHLTCFRVIFFVVFIQLQQCSLKKH